MSGENEDILIMQKLAPSIVEIFSDENLDNLGVGFIVSDDGLVVTSRDIISDSQGNLRDSVRVRFNYDGNTEAEAEKLTASAPKEKETYCKDDPSMDIAFLRLEKLPEYGVTPVQLDDKVILLNHFACIGYKKREEFMGVIAKGEIRTLMRIKASNGSLCELIQIYSPNEIGQDMNGAAILDIERGRVIGLLTERYKGYNAADGKTAFALPVKSMLDLCPNLREKNQGLSVPVRFLRAIDEEKSSIYKWIDEVYVPPLEFEEIKESLRRDRIVFITGTKEFGKTFTAVRLLYEFFKEEGYQPRWIKERKEHGRLEGAGSEELAKIMLEEGYIKPHQIVYFEDPFGKTNYESYRDLENYIGSIIDAITRVQDAYVIITSREEVFKEFERERLSSVTLAKFEKKMNLKRASYNTQKKKEMLYRWAKAYGCKWLLDSALTNLVLIEIENYQLLPTPLNIKDFIIASRELLDGEQLDDLMKRKSQETSIRFADEILRMEEDEKILFLAFAYISYGKLNIDFVKNIYDNIVIAWTESNSKNYNDFDNVRRWFEGDKINISENVLEFSHPSYYEAFRYSLGSKKRYNNRISGSRIGDIFGAVLLNLVQEEQAAWSVAYAIAGNFDKLPFDVRNQLLLKLADNDAAAWSVAGGIARNFDKLPPNVQQLLFKLADNDAAAWSVAGGIAANFNKLPFDVRNQLLLKLADKDKAIESVVNAIAANFNKLPPNVQQLLFKLADNDSMAGRVLAIIEENRNNLPDEIRKEILTKIEQKGTT
jgi:hypothetical protein